MQILEVNLVKFTLPSHRGTLVLWSKGEMFQNKNLKENVRTEKQWRLSKGEKITIKWI